MSENRLVCDVAVMGVEGLVHQVQVAKCLLHTDPAENDHRSASRFCIVDETLSIEEAHVERLARGLVYVLPMLADRALASVVERLGRVRTKSAHDESDRQCVPETFLYRPDYGREAPAPGTPRVREID